MCKAFLGLMKYDFHWNVYSSAYSRIFSYSSDIEEIILKIAEASSAHHIVLSSTSGRGGRVSMSAVRKTVFVIFFSLYVWYNLMKPVWYKLVRGPPLWRF